MLNKINGLPAHVLLIHVVIALVPLAALLVVLHAVWPAARRRLGIVTPLVALAALVVVPITTSAGHWFENYLLANDQPDAAWKSRIVNHANLGSTLLWFVIPLFVVAAVLWYLGRRRTAVPAWANAAVSVIAIVVAVANVVQLYRIGDAGAQAVWHGAVH